MKDEIRKLIVEWFHSKVGVKLIADPSLNSLVDEIEALRIHDVVGRSEQLVCDCGNSDMTWYGNDDDKHWFCFNCKKEAN